MHGRGCGGCRSFPQAPDFPAAVSVLKPVWPLAPTIKHGCARPRTQRFQSLYLLNMVVPGMRCHVTCGHRAAAAMHHSEAGHTMSASSAALHTENTRSSFHTRVQPPPNLSIG